MSVVVPKKSVAARRPRASRTAPVQPASRRPLLLPLACTLALGAFTLFPPVNANQSLRASFLAATAVLLTWCAWLAVRAAGRPLSLPVVLRPQHYLQAMAHASIFVYWSFYWSPIRDAAPLIAAQIVFAYAFDALLAWSRRDDWTLGFGPFPIVFSTNLFLRFRDDWFVFQFAMIAVGFLAKELIRWNRDGRRVHVFNPSSFPLALASLLLILTGTSRLTWGQEIATTLFQPPHIFLFIFLVSLPGQYLFGVSTMTVSAVLSTYAFGLAYYAATGTYFFIDDYIPIAVFLGMHLLFTDPSTSPRTELGRIVFGVLYGLSSVGLYSLLWRIGAPTFYDKLLQVPLMNLLVRAIDRAARSPRVAWLDPSRLGAALRPMQRNLAYTAIWILAFTAMSFAHGVGDYHPGHDVRFWQQACAEERRDACEILGSIQIGYCSAGSRWACNEAGILMTEGRIRDRTHGPDAFARACGFGLRVACQNNSGVAPLRSGDPTVDDFLLLLRQGKAPLPDDPVTVLTRACEREWPAACGELAMRYFNDPAPALRAQAPALLQRACDEGHASSCSDLGLMNKRGDLVPRDEARALALLQRACSLGMRDACRWLADEAR